MLIPRLVQVVQIAAIEDARAGSVDRGVLEMSRSCTAGAVWPVPGRADLRYLIDRYA